MKRIAKLPQPPKPVGDPAVEEFDATVANAEKNKQKKQRGGARGNLNPNPGATRRRDPLATPASADTGGLLPDE